MLWRIIANICAVEWVSRAIIRQAMQTPYHHIWSKEGDVLYMGRWWLFNPYSERTEKRWPWLPSIRVHHIMVHDQDRHMHSHPWDARTIILRGWYYERRQGRRGAIKRKAGDTAALRYDEYHRITKVAPDGCWTLFFTWRKKGTWFFNVDGKRIPWREYLGLGD